MIFTTYFAKLKDLPGDVVPIAICAKTPQGYQGLQYKKLAPTYNILMTYKENHDAKQYNKDYKEQILTRLNADAVIKELSALAGGKDFALVCYEKSADFCHRQLVANWLRSHKYQCEEWTPLSKDKYSKSQSDCCRKQDKGNECCEQEEAILQMCR